MTSRNARSSFLHAAAVLTAAATLTGCYHSTQMAATWSDPGSRSLRFQHPIMVFVTTSETLRRSVEDRMAGKFPNATPAYRVLATHVLKTVADPDARIATVFRLATRRKPTPQERSPMRAYLDAQVERYTADQDAATKLVKAGVTPVDPQVDVAQLAALMNLTAVVMNTPDAYSLR